MSRIETVMWCIAYALGQSPGLSDIRQSKPELFRVDPKCVDVVFKSIEFLQPYMSAQELSRFQRQLCTCMLSAAGFRIPQKVLTRDKRGYPICPQCQTSLDRDYQAYCDRCGQHLAW